MHRTSLCLTNITFVQVDARLVEGGSIELPELARAAAWSLKQAAIREERWVVRLEQLTKTSAIQSGVQSVAKSQQVGTSAELEVCQCALTYTTINVVEYRNVP